jgi:hypothetical protein
MKTKIQSNLAALKVKRDELMKLHVQRLQELRNVENELNQVHGAITLAQSLLDSFNSSEASTPESEPEKLDQSAEKA